MFPFKTKQFSFQTDLPVDQLQYLLATKVRKWRLFHLQTDGQLYGTINDNSASIEIGQSFQRNTFRPVVVFKWTQNNSKTEIKGFYRVALSVILTTLFIPLFGLYLAIMINSILPLLFLFIIWVLIYFTFGRWLFNKDLRWTEEEFLKLINN